MFLTVGSWNALDGKLSTGHIIAITFFAIFIIAMILATLFFITYKKHIKNIYEVKRKIIILGNNTLGKKIKRISNIANTQDKATNMYAIDTILKSVYIVTVYNRGLSLISSKFLKSISEDKLTIPSIRNIKMVLEYKNNLEVVEKNIEALERVTDGILKTEWDLRDSMIGFQKILESIQELYKTNVKSFTSGFNVTERDYMKFEKKISTIMTNFDSYIKSGNYNNASVSLKMINNEMQKFLEEVYVTPQTMDYIKNIYKDDMSKIASFISEEQKNRFTNLNISSTNKIQQIMQDLKSSNYLEANTIMRDIQSDINLFVNELRYQNEIKTFFSERKEEIYRLISEINSFYLQVKKEDTDQFIKNKRELKRMVYDPINEIDNVLVNFANLNEEEIVKAKEDFEKNINTLIEGIRILKNVKTIEGKLEQQYIDFLSIAYLARTDLMASRRILDGAGKWMDLERLAKHEKEYEELKKDIEKLNYKDFEEYKTKVPTGNIAKTRAVQNKTTAQYIEKLREDLEYQYNMYELSKTIIVILEMKNSKEFESLKNQIVKKYDDKKYTEVVNYFLEYSNEIMNRRI